jgi:general secretion pathway protein H
MSGTGERRAAASGFTLIELLVVIAVLALAMTIIPSLLPRVQAKAELTAAAHAVAAALRDARGRAISSGRTAAFILDTRTGRFGAEGTRALHTLPRSVRPTLVTTTDETIAETVGAIRFFTDGSSTGGGVRLAAGARRYDVLVDWLTGRISIGEAQAGS